MEAFLKEFQHLKIQLEEIKSATCNFDNNNVIGAGGFGKVYGGVVSHSKGKSMVAFKRLDRSYGQGDPEFRNEILMLSRYTNENLISLLGFCDMDGEKILVYEHAYHGSLDHHLSSTILTWRQRLKICLAAAKGLSCLHDPMETQQRVLHRDIKSSNILLDDNWSAKVSDMGLSKMGPANQQHTFLVSNVVGTLGYIDPMYMQTGILTKESDVYSFGVVLFEVLCGRLCYENENGLVQTLGNTWKKCYKRKKLEEIIFQDLKQQVCPSSLKTFSDIAYRCLKKSRDKRPDMDDVVEKLKIALWYQETFEEVEPTIEYEEMITNATTPVVNKFKHKVKVVPSKGIVVNVLTELCLKFFNDIYMWRNPITMVSFHVTFIILVCYPDLILSTVFLYMFGMGIWYHTHVNTKISQVEVMKLHNDPLRGMVERIQIVVGGIPNQVERMQSLLSWSDPQATAIFVTFCLVASFVFFVTPFWVIATLALFGLYVMSHPRFRHRLL